jgi:hypothetical protein
MAADLASSHTRATTVALIHRREECGSMKRSKLLRLVPVVAFLAAVSCNEDEVGTSTPVDETLEAKLAQTLPGTVMPLIGFMKTVSGRLTIFPTSGTTGLDCPETTDWCSTGTATCYLDHVDGLDRIFTFDECVVAGADRPLTLDGTVSAIPSTLGPGLLGEITIPSLVLNDSPPISGAGKTFTQTCQYDADVHAGDTWITGYATICDADTYPSGGQLYLVFSHYQITIAFDGTSTPPASAIRTGGNPVADCEIDLETLTASCVRI